MPTPIEKAMLTAEKRRWIDSMTDETFPFLSNQLIRVTHRPRKENLSIADGYSRRKQTQLM